jgi:hypothetical protein
MANWCWKRYKKCRPTDDPVVIAAWNLKYPGHCWAVCPTKSFVLDVDTKDGKNGLVSALAAGGLTPTMIVRTPSGGFHYYYRFDEAVPYLVANAIVKGIDIRYGQRGYVVAPFSVKENGEYEIITYQESLEGGLLAPIPIWLATKVHALLEKRRLKAEAKARLENKRYRDVIWKIAFLVPLFPYFQTLHHSIVVKCNTQPKTPLEEYTSWKGIRPDVRFKFFMKSARRMLWAHQPLSTMIDHTQSCYELEIAMGFCNVGATDEEIAIAYRYWCRKHGFEAKSRFFKDVLPAARINTYPYIVQYELDHPPPVKHGTTTKKILNAIVAGSTSCKAIVTAIGVRANTVAVALSRLVSSGRLIRTSGVYSLPPTALQNDPQPVA